MIMESKSTIIGEKSKISKNPIATIDTKMGDLLKWDTDGMIIDYATSPDRFLEIPVEVLKELSFENKQRYVIAKQLAAIEREDEPDSWKKDIVITEQYASPTERLEVKGKKNGFAYYISTEGKVGKHEREGYTVVPSGSGESIGLSGENTIKTAGKVEMVLMKTTEENAVRLRAEKDRLNKMRKGAMVEQVKDVGNRNDIRTFETK